LAFDRGNARVDANEAQYADYRDVYPELVAHGGGQLPWEVEYDVDFPVDATYTLHIRYASPEPRPIVSSHIYSDHWDGARTMGGNLCILSPVSPNGEAKEIARGLAGGLFGRFDLSFDAKRVVFAYKPTENDGLPSRSLWITSVALVCVPTAASHRSNSALVSCTCRSTSPACHNCKTYSAANCGTTISTAWNEAHETAE